MRAFKWGSAWPYTPKLYSKYQSSTLSIPKQNFCVEQILYSKNLTLVFKFSMNNLFIQLQYLIKKILLKVCMDKHISVFLPCVLSFWKKAIILQKKARVSFFKQTHLYWFYVSTMCGNASNIQKGWYMNIQ